MNMFFPDPTFGCIGLVDPVRIGLGKRFKHLNRALGMKGEALPEPELEEIPPDAER